MAKVEDDTESADDAASSNELIYHQDDDDDDCDGETAKLISNEKSSIGECFPNVEQDPIILYKRRWVMLLILSLNTAMNGCLFMALSPINDIVRKYYDVHSVGIEWLSNMCVVTYVLLSLPSTYVITRWGIRPVIFNAATCNFVATTLHFAGYRKDRFSLVAAGQVFAAISYSTILQMPGKLSSLWFPANERATATSIGVVMNLFGVAIGFMQPSLMVRSSSGAIESEIKMFYLVQIVTAAAILLLTCLYQERPPHPPSLASSWETPTFSESLKLLWRNKYFVFLSQSYGIYFALFVAIFVLMNPLLTMKFRVGFETRIGWMGFWNNMVAIVAFISIGRVLDRFHKYQLVAVVLNLASMCLWLVFVAVLTNTKAFTVLYIIYVLLGVCFVPYFAVGIEQAAQMTYPVSEVTSSSIMLMFGNMYAFIFIIAFGTLAQYQYLQVVGYSMVGLYVVSSLLAAFAKTDLNRLVSEKSVP